VTPPLGAWQSRLGRTVLVFSVSLWGASLALCVFVAVRRAIGNEHALALVTGAGIVIEMLIAVGLGGVLMSRARRGGWVLAVAVLALSAVPMNLALAIAGVAA
jgi:hypothetical protein